MYQANSRARAMFNAGLLAALVGRFGEDRKLVVTQEEFDSVVDKDLHLHIEKKGDIATISLVTDEECKASGFREKQDERERDEVGASLVDFLRTHLGIDAEVRAVSADEFLAAMGGNGSRNKNVS